MLDLNFNQIAIICLAVLLACYIYYVSIYSFWKKKNVKGPKPVPIFGNFFDVAFLRSSEGEKLRDLYNAWKDKPFIGLYQGTSPVILANDPTLIKHVLIKDFTTFTDRGFPVNEDVDPLSANLFNLAGDRWRGLRNKMSPAFTSGKLRQMYHLLCDCADHFEKHVDNLVGIGEPIECREITARFTTDVIGSCAFGLDMNALSSEGSEFRRIGRKMFKQSFSSVVKRAMSALLPSLFTVLNLRTFDSDITEFFMGSIAETILHRKKNGIVRHDFVDLLTQIQAIPERTDFELTDNLLAAQPFLFFAAGFEASSTTISFALYELAQNQDVQERLRAEIQDALETHNGQLPYEAIKELKYLDKVLQGARFANYQTKMGIIKILKNYRVSISSKTKIPYTIDKHAFFLTPVGGIHLNFTKIM